MGKRWFASLETVRIPLSEGEWIEVKQQLTYAESKRIAQAGFQMPTFRMGDLPDQNVNDAEIHIDTTKLDLLRMELWVVSWSAMQPNRKGELLQVPVTREAIEALDPDMAKEISEALDAHINAQEQAKNVSAGERSPETK